MISNGTIGRALAIAAFAAVAAAATWVTGVQAAPPSASETVPKTAPITVVTTIAQIGEPIGVIAAGRARVLSLIGEGVDPHLYRLTRSDVAKLVGADLILYSGLHLEAQMLEMMERFAERKRVVAIGDALAEDGLLPGTSGATDAVHDPHVWMDPQLWKKALAAALDALAATDPANADFYRANAADYFAKLDALDTRARTAIASIPPAARALVTAHDAFGYFGRSYGIEVMAIQGISTESEAGIRRIENLVSTLAERKIGAVFVETSVSQRNVRALIEGAAARGHAVRIGGALFSDAMGPKGGYTGTYLGMFDHNVTAIVRALGGDAPETGLAGQLAEAGETR